jgi:sugar phosphate isomerase/epimerase
MYVSSQLGARFCRLGTWPPLASVAPAGQNLSAAQNLQIRATMLRNDLTQFATTGLRCNILPLLANHAGSFPGRSLPEVNALLAGVPANAFGYCFDPAQAVIEAGSATGWEAALEAALPRLGAVALSDVAFEKETASSADAPSNPRPCPLGEGVIDWKKFFAALAAARFHGPVSMHMDYAPRNPVTAMTKDLAFARAHVDSAWPPA